MECPCLSQKNYEECCGLLHSGEKTAQTAEELMRSRYNFCESEIDFIVETHHPETRSSVDKKEIEICVPKTRRMERT